MFKELWKEDKSEVKPEMTQPVSEGENLTQNSFKYDREECHGGGSGQWNPVMQGRKA